MQLHFLSKHTGQVVRYKKGGRINPHRFWNVFLVSFLLVLTGIVVYTTLFFARTLSVIDGVVLPDITGDVRPIERMKRTLEKTEKVVQDRVRGLTEQ